MHRRTKTLGVTQMVVHGLAHGLADSLAHGVAHGVAQGVALVLHMVMHTVHRAASGKHETGKSSPQDPPTQTLSKN